VWLSYSVAEEQLFFKELEGRNRWCFAEVQREGEDGGGEGERESGDRDRDRQKQRQRQKE
jgi:hypothetical protein